MHLGIIGYGNIAQQLVTMLAAPKGPCPERITLLVRPERQEGTAQALADQPIAAQVVTQAQALADARPDLVVECAGHAGAAAHVPALLRAGIDVVLVSVGALADDALHDRLRAAAEAGGAHLILPAGAVGGIDLLSALSGGGEVELTYRGIKPPAAWSGTPAAQAIDLDAVTHATPIFTGTAREAARAFPKNANVAATLALAGPGLDATRVELIADPAASGNLHSYEVRSGIANYTMTIENKPSAGNARTSLATGYSVLREIRNRMMPVIL
ncbi:aspartate dehydrogenase [Salinihabitans flavidus]|uniref:L-aspartate dehydrogenase n=1 Tax=Salinihabitans flavidus TaxID=569882 RepID=A0A1H8U6B6_9RHOB|nr:aspartate dehydrogenase [Salinihabitans flavidus]SEO98749.1 aspartate dehydrogenase [Salinihabitans flavidus]